MEPRVVSRNPSSTKQYYQYAENWLLELPEFYLAAKTLKNDKKPKGNLRLPKNPKILQKHLKEETQGTNGN